jgi:hypothetical protein
MNGANEPPEEKTFSRLTPGERLLLFQCRDGKPQPTRENAMLAAITYAILQSVAFAVQVVTGCNGGFNSNDAANLCGKWFGK